MGALNGIRLAFWSATVEATGERKTLVLSSPQAYVTIETSSILQASSFLGEAGSGSGGRDTPSVRHFI